ncbi:MAG: aminotransferase class III-fold pyridoxal phosphate-dependent enzyme [Sphingomonas sp.]
MPPALTGKVQPYKAPFGAMPAGVFHAPFPSEETGITIEESLRALDFLFRADVAPTDVAAIIVEPVQGEGGFHIAAPAFLKALRAICDAHGILLVADEVQTGFGRTGRMFGIEHAGVEPDLVAMAKSLGGGFPLSAVTGRAEVMDQRSARRAGRHLCRIARRLRRRAGGARHHRRRRAASTVPRRSAGAAWRG